MIQIFSNKELRSFKRIGIDFGKQTFKRKEVSSNEKFTNDFLRVFRYEKEIKENENTLIKLTEKQKGAVCLLSTKKESFLFGGGRSGKTTLIVLKIIFECLYNNAKVLCLRENFSDITTSLFPTFLEIINLYNIECKTNKSSPMQFSFLHGGEITLRGVQGGTKRTQSDKNLGSEYSIIYFNEASQIGYQTFKTLKTRLNKPKQENKKDLLPTQLIIDCNPPSKNHWVYSYFILNQNPETDISFNDDFIANIGILKINPIDNIDNIQDDYISSIEGLGGKDYIRFVQGEFSNNDDNSIFKENYFKYYNINEIDTYDDIVIGVDPAVKSGANSDETGIVVCGVVKNQTDIKYYVLSDFSGRMTTDTWIRKVVNLYNIYNEKTKIKTTVVIETNQGGALLKNSLRDANNRNNINISEIHSSKSKFDRAFYISALYEKGAVYHASSFDKLQGQMIALGGDEFLAHDDRVDAIVHALTHLFNKYQKPKSMLSQHQKLIF